jgi:hypothetical protein
MRAQVGDKIQVTVEGNGSHQTVPVTLGSPPAS